MIGWQARFYDTKLSNNKNGILNCVEKTNREYPEVTQLYFYTNKEWGQGRSEGQKSKPLIDIEKRAAELNIEIVWNVASFFESEFVSKENKDLAKHFFELEKSIFDVIKVQKNHTTNILSGIKTSIDFNNQHIEIDRSEQLEKLKTQSTSTFILTGNSGVGKTAVIKKYCEQVNDDIPFYVFKSSEFDLRSVNELLADASLDEFIEAHKPEKKKVIVIDSAEKLLDLKNPDPAKEFLGVLIQNEWDLIFTITNVHLRSLKHEFLDANNITPLVISINELEHTQLSTISNKYSLTLPTDQKLLELIRNPFYLSEYSRAYSQVGGLNYHAFKNKLWESRIKRSKPSRERCFLQIAVERANSGQFFVVPNCDASILDDELVEDGILGYETAGYFITHDIYEGWALEKNIEREFINRRTSLSFFEAIGSSLAICKSFKNWLSEKLMLNDSDIKNFIEDTIDTNDIEQQWKKEIFLAILYSEDSEEFFSYYEDKLLANNQELLKQITASLRIAHQEVDDDLIMQLNPLVESLDISDWQHTLTKPKGKGWQSLLKFTYDNLDIIGIENINFILPVLHDWNSKFKEGETTKRASLIALQYYQFLQEKQASISSGGSNKLLQTIIFGSSEIKNELAGIFEEILKHGWKTGRDPHYALTRFILMEIEGLSVAHVLPNYVLKLADLIWTYTRWPDDIYLNQRMGLEQHFNMTDDALNYHSASAYRTPIYWLLASALQETVDFILSFTNKTVEYFAKSDFAKYEIEEIEVVIDDSQTIRQYICDRLWRTHRGTHASPTRLESIHMALEKFLMERGKYTDAKSLESWLIYLLKNSRSASITAVVTSVVLAYPEKTSKIAKILFKTQQFFGYDQIRFEIDQTHKDSLLFAMDIIGGTNSIYDNERLNACDDEHRKSRLKDLLPPVDIIGMPPLTEEVENGTIIRSNPKSGPELRPDSKQKLAGIPESAKYSRLKFWAHYKIQNNKRYEQYTEYENDPIVAIREVKSILQKKRYRSSGSPYLSCENNSIPADVCSILIRDHFAELAEEEKVFCKDELIRIASSFLKPKYEYKLLDGSQSALSVLPLIFKAFSEERETVKTILLMGLLYQEPIDKLSIEAIHQLRQQSFVDADSMLIGYLKLKPKYDKLREKIQKNYGAGIYEINNAYLMEEFKNENDEILQRFIKNELTLGNIEVIKDLDLGIQKTAFQLLPNETASEIHKEIARIIITSFAENPKINSNMYQQKVKNDFLNSYAHFVLTAPEDDIKEYLNPILDNFNNQSLSISDMLYHFIDVQDRLERHKNFWIIWNLFKRAVLDICSKRDRYTDGIVKSYLFAQNQNPWDETAQTWHTLQANDKKFFKEISSKLGHCPSAIYAISKLLNGIGSIYIDDGISWLSKMLKNNQGLESEDLEDEESEIVRMTTQGNQIFKVTDIEKGTIIYLEKIAQRYIDIDTNRKKIRQNRQTKDEVLIILNFLVDNGSAVGHQLRESVI